MVTVYFLDHKCNVPVEIQLRTIAMEFCAALAHQLWYKKNRDCVESMQTRDPKALAIGTVWKRDFSRCEKAQG